ncbi:MAG TPA: hypothetical protein PLK67_18225, partial [Bryobacteraceae bacterium]|nr:hypothetical protein [Bryobacteraceae bacterium]
VDLSGAEYKLLRMLLEHLVLSHHGSLEFGSPKVPMFPEALLLHYLDDLDAKMACMTSLVENDRQVEGHFTPYSAQLERVVLKKAKFLEDGEPERAESEAAPPVAASASSKPRPSPPPKSPMGSLFAEKLGEALGLKVED